MRLQHELLLQQARVVGIATEPTKDDPKITLAIRASLTREVAEAFGCRDIIYAGKVPRSGVDKMALAGEELDCEVHFKHDSMAFDAVANSVGRYVARMDGDGPKLLFRIKLTGYATTVADLADKVHIDPLEIMLKPSQMNLHLVEETPPDDSRKDLTIPDDSPADEEDFLDELETPVPTGSTP